MTALALDMNLWGQKWQKMNSAQQRDFLLSQMDRSQESTAFKDIPLIMMNLATEHHLKALALAAATGKANASSSSSSASSPSRLRGTVQQQRMSSASADSAPPTTIGDAPAADSPISYALHSRQYSFVTPSLIFKEVWALLKPSPNVRAKVDVGEREQRLPANYSQRRPSAQTAGTSVAGSGGGPLGSLNTSSVGLGTSSGSLFLGSTVAGGGTNTPTPTATRIEFHRIEDEYLDAEERRAAVRREELQAARDMAPTVPSPLACDLMDGWSVGPQQLDAKRAAVNRAEEALIEIAASVVCGIKGIDPEAEALREGGLSAAEAEEDTNMYSAAKPSVPKAVRWLARRLLHSVLGYDVLAARHEALLLENFDAQWNAVTPLSAILGMLHCGWEQRRVPNDVHSRAVVEEARRAPAFHAALPWEQKECMILGACANFAFVLFSLWVGPKWGLSEFLPRSLTAAKVFTSRRKRQAAPTGLLMDYLNVKSVYEDVEGELARRVAEPDPLTRLLARHTAAVVEQRLPALSRALSQWSEGPLELGDEAVGKGAAPTEKLLIAATRSWYESLFTAPTPHNTHYDTIHAHNSVGSGGRGLDSARAGSSSGRPTSAQMLRRLQTDEQYGADGALMTEGNCSLFWRYFIAFGWPFVAKLGVQVLLEASSDEPLLIHSGSPADLSAYAVGGGAASGLSVYAKTLPPIVTDPALEAIVRKVDPPLRFRRISLLNEFMDGPPASYIDLNDLRVMQKAFLVALNRVPSCATDLQATIRRVEQWDQCLYESMRADPDPATAALLRRWDQLFISAQHAKKKTRSILQAIGAEVDAMERILPMAPANRY